MKFLTKPLGLGILALVIYLTTIGALYMRSKGAIIEAIGAGKGAAGVVDESSEFVYWSFKTNEVNKLIRELNEERLSLQKRSDELASEEARNSAERKELERLRQEIEVYRKELSGYLLEVKQTKLDRLKTEVAILGTMEPANIVTLFEEKNDDEVVELMSLMKPDAVAPIIERMMAAGGSDKEPPARRAARLLEKLQRLKVAQAQ